MKKRLRTFLMAVAALFVLVIALSAPLWADLELARMKREGYRYGSEVVLHPLRKSAEQFVDGLKPKDYTVASSSGGLVSDHDLYILVHAALGHIEKDPELVAARDAGKLPVRYSYLDGHDINVLCFKKALANDLPEMPVPDAGDRSTWAVAPVWLGLPASPNVRDVVAETIADAPLLSVHTAGQVTSAKVRESGVRYALTGIAESPAERAAEIATCEERVAELAAAAEAEAPNDDRAYTQAAFRLLYEQCTYAYEDEATSIHANDVYGALVEGSSRCYGLSGALKLLVEARNIPCYLANGTKSGTRHTVLNVYLEGSWHTCDITLALGALEDEPDTSVTRNPAYACLVSEHRYNTEHHFTPDDTCRLLELVYQGIIAEFNQIRCSAAKPGGHKVPGHF